MSNISPLIVDCAGLIDRLQSCPKSETAGLISKLRDKFDRLRHQWEKQKSADENDKSPSHSASNTVHSSEAPAMKTPKPDSDEMLELQGMAIYLRNRLTGDVTRNPEQLRAAAHALHEALPFQHKRRWARSTVALWNRIVTAAQYEVGRLADDHAYRAESIRRIEHHFVSR